MAETEGNKDGELREGGEEEQRERERYLRLFESKRERGISDYVVRFERGLGSELTSSVNDHD